MPERQENIIDVPVPTRSRRSLASSRAWWVAGAYALFATLWIYLSDHALAWVVQDADLFLAWSVYKGVAFVAVTSLLLLLLIRRAFGSLENALIALRLRDEQRRQQAAQRRATEERYRATLDSMLEGCQIIGCDWRYLYLNKAAEQHNRRPNSELLGRTMPEAWPGIEQTPVYRQLKRCLEERIALNGEIRFDFPDGGSGWFDVHCQPVPEGVFVLSIDVSERRAAEDALRHLNQTLELKVADRTRELEVALVRAEAADRIKSAFLATMSHELRTPLNSIIGFTGIVLQELAGPLNEEQSRQLGMVQSSARHLLDLINDVLDLSKIEAGQLEVRADAVDLNEVIAQVIETITPLAADKGLALQSTVSDDLGAITGDQRRLKQVLLNLVNNAIKFTDEGSVSLDAQRGDDNVTIRITDTGIGIRPEHLELLFQPFRQVDVGLTRQHDGTGLGLAICRRLVDLMGGAIAVSSEWGRGSEFRVKLPVGADG